MNRILSPTLTLYDQWNSIAEYATASGATPALTSSYTWGLDLSGRFQGGRKEWAIENIEGWLRKNDAAHGLLQNDEIDSLIFDNE